MVWFRLKRHVLNCFIFSDYDSLEIVSKCDSMHVMIKGLSMNLYPFKITDTWFYLSVHIIQQTYCTNKVIFIDKYWHLCNVHSYNKCKVLDRLFIFYGAVHASCISINPFKTLSIHVNHETFQESKTLFLLICKRRPLLFVAYDI
jgi:hypothetical protein